MPINYEAAKTLIRGLVQKMKSFRGNWNQNDPTADDYIKNRPFYTEQAEIVILPETTIYGEGNVNIKSPLVVGQEYKITWNGVVYRSIARNYDSYRMIGNNAVYEYDNGIEDNTGEPFAAEANGNNLKLYFYMDDTVTEPPTVSITTIGESVHKIDSKYIDIPANIATTDDVNKKMDATNPVGTGSFSMNRKADITIGNYSHAEGYYSAASGEASHAEGSNTYASGKASHAEGRSTQATGFFSHAEGDFSVASGMHSHAEGGSTIAAGKNQHAQGKFNIEDTENKYAHIVGNGTSGNARSNAHTLDWDGNAWFAGTVEGTAFVLPSSTEGSTKKFKITVDDSGTISATEVT